MYINPLPAGLFFQIPSRGLGVIINTFPTRKTFSPVVSSIFKASRSSCGMVICPRKRIRMSLGKVPWEFCWEPINFDYPKKTLEEG
jgi:hypothetical protein